MTNTIRLPAHCGVRDSSALKQQLLALLDAPEAIVIDVGAVERTDTAILQLLFAFCPDRLRSGRQTVWEGDSSELRSAAAALNLIVGPTPPLTPSGVDDHV